MRVLSVVGARPQFVKLAPVAEAFHNAGVEHATVHTGQHYDYGMSDVFFDELGIAAPSWNLGIGSGSHGAQTGAMLAGLDELFDIERPDWVLVYGDTNSTLAAAVAAVKLHLRVAHLEAGLRSFNRAMPEEHNRVLTDHASDLLLAPTQLAANRLETEGLGDRTKVVGDVMVDVLLQVKASLDAARPDAIQAVVGDSPYVLATIHRAENTDEPSRLRSVLSALAQLEVPVVLPLHPRVRAVAAAEDINLDNGILRTIDPLPYREMVAAVDGAMSITTDSGGLQKEAFVLGKVVTTIRTETEWVETLEDGWNVLVPTLEGLADQVLRPAPTTPRCNPYGSGHAADAAVAAIVEASL